MLARIFFAAFIFLAAAITAQATYFQAQVYNTGNAPSNQFGTFKIGAGGYITGIDVAGQNGDTADGVMVNRTDTYGGYIWNGSIWTQCVTINSMPAGDLGISNTTGDPVNGGAQGIYEIRLAPSNHAMLYMVYNGYVYKSTNSCSTWTKTNLAQKTNTDPNNGATKVIGYKLAVDPSDANIVYFGAPSGLFRTSDGGANWSTIASVPSSSNSIIVTIDWTSASGGSRIVYASSHGNGVYRSSDGGSTFTKISGSGTGTTALTDHVGAKIDQNGVYWHVAATGSQTLWKYASSTWSNINTGGQGGRTFNIAIDLNNANNIYAAIDGGNLQISTDGGANWTGPNFGTQTRVGTGDITWLGNTNEVYMSNGNMVWNKANGRLYFSEGIGVWYASSLVLNTTWQAQSVGIEQLVANQVIVSPNGRPVVAAWDRPSFYSANSNIYPSIQNPNTSVSINMGWAVDWSPQTNSTMVGLFNWFGPIDYSGKSTDGGQSWSAFATTPALSRTGSMTASISGTTMTVSAFPGSINLSVGCDITGSGVSVNTSIIAFGSGTGTTGTYTITPSQTVGSGSISFSCGVAIGGTILAASDNHYIIVQNNTNRAGVFYTANSGSTWTEATVGSVPSTSSGSATGWGNSYSYNRHVGDCDKTTTDTCYIFNPGDGTTLPNFSGVYKTTNGGSSWSRVFTGVITTYSDGFFNVTLRCVPGKSGHLFYTGGGSTGSGSISTTQDLKRSSDGGVTWSSVPNVKNVYAIGFGKDNGGAYPAIYIAGLVTFNGGSTYSWGIYRSLDGDQATPTWTLLQNYPINSGDTITWLEGDPSNYGYAYVGFRGSGWAYGYFP